MSLIEKILASVLKPLARMAAPLINQTIGEAMAKIDTLQQEVAAVNNRINDTVTALSDLSGRVAAQQAELEALRNDASGGERVPTEVLDSLIQQAQDIQGRVESINSNLTGLAT